MGKRLFISLLATIALVGIFAKSSGLVGESVEVTNGVGDVQAGSSLPALLGAAAIVIAYILALDPEGLALSESAPTTVRRALAWVLDFLFALTAISAVVALIPLGAEAIATGQFQWQFERSEVFLRDWLLSFVSIPLTFIGLAFYWALPIAYGGQTIGQAMAGLAIVSDGRATPSFKRLIVRGLANTVAPLLWLSKAVSGRPLYWHDEYAHTKAVRTETPKRAAA